MTEALTREQQSLMPRLVRIEYPGAFYHVLARGDRREKIFVDDEDRLGFLDLLERACEKAGWRVHAYVLMSNHYHWVLETPEANLVAGMRWFQNALTRRFNVRHSQWGHLFGGRYKAVLIDEGGDYLASVLDYVHLNPVRAGLIDSEKGVTSYRWSSLTNGYALVPRRRPRWLAVERGFALAGLEDNAAGRRELIARLNQRAAAEAQRRCGWISLEGQTLNSTLARGWYWGSEEFRKRLLKMLDSGKARGNRNYQTSRQGQDHERGAAEALIAEGLSALALDEATLRQSRGSEPRKVAIAWAVTRSTTVSQAWIAERLVMGSAANVSQQVRRFAAARHNRGHLPKAIVRWIQSVKNC